MCGELHLRLDAPPFVVGHCIHVLKIITHAIHFPYFFFPEPNNQFLAFFSAVFVIP